MCASVDHRPGDRIVLDPGEHVVADVYIPWPLHLVGGGMAAEDTILRCQDSNDSALDFRWSSSAGYLFASHELSDWSLAAVCLLTTGGVCHDEVKREVLFFCRASGRVANLTIQSTANACITHRQGNLTVEVRMRCKLAASFCSF